MIHVTAAVLALASCGIPSLFDFESREEMDRKASRFSVLPNLYWDQELNKAQWSVTIPRVFCSQESRTRCRLFDENPPEAVLWLDQPLTNAYVSLEEMRQRRGQAFVFNSEAFAFPDPLTSIVRTLKVTHQGSISNVFVKVPRRLIEGEDYTYDFSDPNNPRVRISLTLTRVEEIKEARLVDSSAIVGFSLIKMTSTGAFLSEETLEGEVPYRQTTAFEATSSFSTENLSSGSKIAFCIERPVHPIGGMGGSSYVFRFCSRHKTVP
jgi:hypothetical protein